jgi:hypothetical protein
MTLPSFIYIYLVLDTRQYIGHRGITSVLDPVSITLLSRTLCVYSYIIPLE